MLIEIYVFLIGLCIGSFLNVCIYRLPNSESIVHPRSSCPQCGEMIKVYDNIPVASYIALGRRCRFCRVKIPLRYPVVELLGGLFALAVFFKFGLRLESLIYYVYIVALITVTFIDIDHRIIPDRITLPGIPLFFAASFGLPAVTYVESLLGVLVGGGSLLLVAWVYSLVTKKEGMGGGDIKLLAMIGAVIGWKGVLFTIFIGSLTGTLAGVAAMLQAGRTENGMKLKVPFGPFLSIGGILYIFFGTELIRWYLNFLG